MLGSIVETGMILVGDLHVFDPHRPVVLEAHRMPATVGGGRLIAAAGLALHCGHGLAAGGLTALNDHGRGLLP
jgi:hypothetical protein